MTCIAILHCCLLSAAGFAQSKPCLVWYPHPPILYFLLDMLVVREWLLPLEPPSLSRSRNSANAVPTESCLPRPSKSPAAIRDGVLGVRFHTEIGVRRLGFDAPGRARPARSCWSVWRQP